jgi:ribonuclease H2 subunit A
MFDIMNKNEFRELGFFTSVLHAEYLSNTMKAENGRGGKNLNKISHDTAIDLINKVKSCGVNLKRVILDTVGQPESYKRLLRERLNDPNLEIIVESKADSTYPVVSAASIAAKVTRD